MSAEIRQTAPPPTSQNTERSVRGIAEKPSFFGASQLETGFVVNIPMIEITKPTMRNAFMIEFLSSRLLLASCVYATWVLVETNSRSAPTFVEDAP